MFIVVQRGVYRHDIHGAWGDEGDAVAAAERIALADSDCYHEYEVMILALDGEITEGEVIATVRTVPGPKRPGYTHRSSAPASVTVERSDGHE